MGLLLDDSRRARASNRACRKRSQCSVAAVVHALRRSNWSSSLKQFAIGDFGNFFGKGTSAARRVGDDWPRAHAIAGGVPPAPFPFTRTGPFSQLNRAADVPTFFEALPADANKTAVHMTD